MKKLYTLITAIALYSVTFYAQSPDRLSYQAVIRNSNNQLVVSAAIGIRISILQGTVTGTAVYVETHNQNSNENGLVTVEVGGGTVVSGDFATIDWSAGPYFIMTETDPSGGTVYSLTGTSQLLSVPYALHAKSVDSYDETDPLFDASVANNIAAADISNWNNAFSWGNHATAGYLTNFNEIDPVWTAASANYYTKTNLQTSGSASLHFNNLTNKPVTLSGYGINDAMNTSHAANAITSTNISNWNSAYGWGNHSGLYRPISYVPAWSEITSNPFVITSPLNNQLLRYNSTSGKWENWTPAYLTAEVDGSVTNEIELPSQTGNSGKLLITDGTSPSWTTLTKTSVGLGNVENTALSTWTGSSNVTTLGTVSTGTWQGTAINESYIGNFSASKTTSGTFDNARINWAAPGAIGSTTAASGAFSSLSVSNGLVVSNGNVNIKPGGNQGTNGFVLTTDGTGNATWNSVQAPKLNVSTQNTNYVISVNDGFIITNGGYTYTLPAAASAGTGKCIYLYSKVSAITLMASPNESIWDASGNSHSNPSTFTTYSGMYVSDGVNTWFEVAK
jgi:hypothetical protein